MARAQREDFWKLACDLPSEARRLASEGAQKIRRAIRRIGTARTEFDRSLEPEELKQSFDLSLVIKKCGGCSRPERRDAAVHAAGE